VGNSSDRVWGDFGDPYHQAGVDTSVIALWLGHADVRSTQAYLHADMTIKQRALARTAPASAAPGRYRPGDSLLGFLEAL